MKQLSKYNLYKSIIYGNLYLVKYAKNLNIDTLFEQCCKLESENTILLFPTVPAPKQALYYGYVGFYTADKIASQYRIYDNVNFIHGLCQSSNYEAVEKIMKNMDTLSIKKLAQFCAIKDKEYIFDMILSREGYASITPEIVLSSVDFKYIQKVITNGASPDHIMQLIIAQCVHANVDTKKFTHIVSKLQFADKHMLLEFSMSLGVGSFDGFLLD